MSFSKITEVIIDKPLLAPQKLGFDDGTISNVVYTSERYLPRILVNIGYFKSNSEVRKNRPDLVITLDKPDMVQIWIGKKVLQLLVGLNEEDYKAYEEAEKAYGDD